MTAPADTVASLPVVERLRRASYVWSLNPSLTDQLDEAAELITAYDRALSELLELVVVHGLEPCRDFEPHEFDAIVDGAVHDARKVLAKARQGAAK